jgi:hypothetical protein
VSKPTARVYLLLGITLAIVHTFLTADIPGKSDRKLFGLLMGNTTVAIIIGLIVAIDDRLLCDRLRTDFYKLLSRRIYR